VQSVKNDLRLDALQAGFHLRRVHETQIVQGDEPKIVTADRCARTIEPRNETGIRAKLEIMASRERRSQPLSPRLRPSMPV